MNDLFAGDNSASHVESKSASCEERWTKDRAACLARFEKAVAAGKRRDYRQCEAIIANVRAKHGDAAADIAAKELKAAIKHEPKTKRA